MERRTRSRNRKLSGKRSVEVKVISKEITPTKAIIPQAHSTPIESKVVSKSNESDDSDEEPDMCFTQDMLEVQWDYSNTPNRKEKKKRSKPKRKSKGGTFTKNKKWQEFSPNGAVFVRKRFIKEEPKADLTKLIVGLQVLAEKVKEEQGVCKNGIQKDLHYVEHLNDDIDRSVGAKTARKQLLVPSSPQEEVVTKTVSENYTSLFDDDEDDCIVRCSQEIEQKLHEPNAIECTTKEECSSDSMTPIPTKNSDLDENKSQNCYDNEVIKESLKICKDGLSIGKEACHVNDTQKLKGNCILPNSDLGKNANNESFSALFEDDADDCMVLCSQEIEEKFSDNNKLPNNNARHHTKTKLSFTTVSSPKQVNSKKAKSNSDNIGFDDSLDMLLQNFTEEDIDKMSHGVPVKKNVTSLTTMPETRQAAGYKLLNSGSVLSRRRCEVARVPCVKNVPSTDTEKKLNVHCRTLHADTAKTSYFLPKTSPQKCTPVEIEIKRLEARKRLEMKKLSMCKW